MIARSDFTGDALRLAITTDVARQGIAKGMTYYLYSTVDCRFKVSDGVTATCSSTTGYPLPARTYLGPVIATSDTPYIASVADSTSGTLCICPVY
jgi:hypothetical protein